jgi:integrase
MTDTMRLNLKGYCPQPGRGGRTRHRVRVKGNPNKKITIPCGPDHEDFMEHYRAARMAEVFTPKPQPGSNAIKGSFDEAKDLYLSHLERCVKSGTVSPKTLKQRRSLLCRAVDFMSPSADGLPKPQRMGLFERVLPTEAIEHIRDEWGGATAQADNCVKALVAMYKWMKVSPNPARGIDKVHVSKGGAMPWSSDDLRAFLKTHRPGTAPHVWLMLSMFTGARREDLAMLGRGHEVQRHGLTCIEWQPTKKGSAFVSLPMVPQLYEATRATTVQGKAYILNAHGRPYANGNSLGTRVQRWTSDAGLTKRSSHGLRKALGTLLAEVGCSNRQIMAVLAHTKATTSEVYTESADRARMAHAAIEAIKHVKI